MTQYEWNIEDSKAKAIRRGDEVVEGDSHTLLLDLDSEDAHQEFQGLMAICSEKLNLSERRSWRSRSGKGWHVEVNCDPMNASERVMMQAVLCSDRKRAVLALMMIADGIAEPSLLFKPAHQEPVQAYRDTRPASVIDDDTPF